MISESMQSIVNEIELISQKINLLPVIVNENEFSRMLQQNSTAWAPSSGDTAWMLFSTAIVLFMTMPGNNKNKL